MEDWAIVGAGVVFDEALAGAAPPSPVWSVGALCQRVGQQLDASFNPLRVRGEILGWNQASSGHCYFTLKDARGQLRCAMFRRAASQVGVPVREGMQVELLARLGVYEPRGDLQLIVEALQPLGQGSLYEQFVRLKADLAAQGWFDAERKRALPRHVRCVGVVTSSAAAALRDVLQTLRRRAPHVHVVLSPAAVQGAAAAPELIQALQNLYLLTQAGQAQMADFVQTPQAPQTPLPPPDVILLVRGGGAIEDLWAFNDPALVRQIAASPVPLISGVGHETDFTLADFVADVRAPTPTAAAELAVRPQAQCLQELQVLQDRAQRALNHAVQRRWQALDAAAARLARPSHWVAQQSHRLDLLAHALRAGVQSALQNRQTQLQGLSHALLAQTQLQHISRKTRLEQVQARWQTAWVHAIERPQVRLQQAQTRLDLLSPQRVLTRGYAWLSTPDGQPLTHRTDFSPGQCVRATLADGAVDLQVRS